MVEKEVPVHVPVERFVEAPVERTVYKVLQCSCSILWCCASLVIWDTVQDRTVFQDRVGKDSEFRSHLLSCNSNTFWHTVEVPQERAVRIERASPVQVYSERPIQYVERGAREVVDYSWMYGSLLSCNYLFLKGGGVGSWSYILPPEHVHHGRKSVFIVGASTVLHLRRRGHWTVLHLRRWGHWTVLHLRRRGHWNSDVVCEWTAFWRSRQGGCQFWGIIPSRQTWWSIRRSYSSLGNAKYVIKSSKLFR